MNKLKSLVNSHWSIVIVILIIAAFLRLYNITETPPGFYPDEAMNGNNALEALSPQGNFKVFYPENNGREGFFINIQAVFLKFLIPLSGGNPEPWMLKIPSALFGVLTVLGIYFLAKELFSEKIALLSSFFLAVSFWHINFSRIGFRAIMAPFFLIWGVYFLLTSLNKLKLSAVQLTGQRVIFLSILGGIFYGLGFHSYIAYRATPLLILIILLYYWLKNKDPESVPQSAERYGASWQIRKKILLSSFLFLLSSFIVFAPLGLYFIENPQDFFGRTTQISIFSAEGGSASGGNSLSILKNLAINILKTAGMFNFSGDWNWRHNIAGRPLLFWPVGFLFLMGIFLGLRIFFKKVSRRLSGHGVSSEARDERSRESSGERLAGARDRVFREEYSQAFIILFTWLIVTALPIVISNEGLPHALRAILMAPAVFILAGVGGVWLYEIILAKIRNKTFLFPLSSFLLLLLIIEAYTAYFILWGKNPNTAGAFNQEYVRLGKELRELPKELPKYVVVEASGVDVRGMPMPTQTIMFLTDTFTPEKQKEKNLYYIFPDGLDKIDQNKNYVVYLK